ncbi:unnamed protein product [Trichobilharzia szidati]|nr:unnamed protein product [Trichobilharzia szidati]
MESVHGGKRYQCDVCGKEFTRADHLKTHMESVHGGKRYQCDVCGKDSTTAGSLKTHMESVHGGKRYQCDVCGKDSTTAGSLKRHMESVHGGEFVVLSVYFVQEFHVDLMNFTFHYYVTYTTDVVSPFPFQEVGAGVACKCSAYDSVILQEFLF